MSEPLDWTEDGPRSPRFGDVYFSRTDGLAESRAVFLTGCGMPEAWIGRSSFTVAELGFGTGLNILALCDLWRRTRQPDARLHVFSVEAFPIAREDAARALAAWPELADLAAPLLAAWPDRRGWSRIALPGDVTLDLAVAEAGDALAQWEGAADAWFLDGFAPARNPEMWTPELLRLVADRSAPGARVASFTVAGAVRRGLAEAGFAVDKRPGFGRKRERLEACLPGSPAEVRKLRVAIVGAGIAGAALVRAFRALGVEPKLVEAVAPGAGASGNPAALVAPRLDAGLGPVARLHAQAFARAVTLYRREAPGAILAEGALQLAHTPRDPGRFAKLAAWDGFAPGALQPLDAAAVAAALDEPAGPEALTLADALTLEPTAVLDAWLDGVSPVHAHWREGDLAIEAEVICIASGAGFSGPVRYVRGQVSWSPTPLTGAPAAWGGYAIPTRDGVLFGATHDRDESDTDVREADHARNLATLAEGRPRLAATLEPTTLEGRAAVRVTTADHLPLAGEMPGAPGMFVLTGLGGRGFTLAPLLAEQVAAMATGAPRPLPRDLAALVDPGRFREEREKSVGA